MWKLVLAAAYLLLAGGAQALTLNVVGDELHGASGVVVDGSFYDVQFLEGTCIDLYNGCDDTSDFTFQTEASAILASQALLDQVFLDGIEGPFDSNPYRTFGCDVVGGECNVLTVFSYLPFKFSPLQYESVEGYDAQNFDAFNIFQPPVQLVGPVLLTPNTNTLGGISSFTFAQTSVFAVWTSTVPEPNTALLLGLGLTGLATKGRRRNRS